jgi:hypothetical protein
MWGTIYHIMIIIHVLQLTVIGQLKYVQHNVSIPAPCCSLSGTLPPAPRKITFYNSGTSNNGHCRGISVLSIIGDVR